MTLGNKRKAAATPEYEEDGTAKRMRQDQRREGAVSGMASPMNKSSSPAFQPLARPKRWRGGHHLGNSESPSSSHQFQNPPKQQPKSTPHPNRASSNHPENISQSMFRFSFNAASDAAQESQGPQDQALNRSFSDLAVTHESAPETGFPANPVAREQTFRPSLSKPKKKREGYGFSYSDSFWCDSDEYPDTECEWEPDEPKSHQPVTPESTPTKQEDHWNAEAPIVQASFGGSTVVDEDFSFDDIVVVRDVGSFHMARPQKKLPCTQGTREDAITLKAMAKALVKKYKESSDIQAALFERMERMVVAEQHKQQKMFPAPTVSIFKCALKLYEFLARVKGERVETGELNAILEHELEWVQWLIDASRTGVMHLKTAVCKCRPDWEEE